MDRRDFAARIVDALNLLHTLDPNIIDELLDWRCLCSDELAEHGDFLADYNNEADQWQIDIMGVLNSFLNLASGEERVEIVAIFNGDTNSLSRFEYHVFPPDESELPTILTPVVQPEDKETE